jgi:hypothetical protein
MRLLQKTCLFLVKIGMPHANAFKSVGCMNTVLFPIIGKAENVQSPHIGKPDIHRRKD